MLFKKAQEDCVSLPKVRTDNFKNHEKTGMQTFSPRKKCRMEGKIYHLQKGNEINGCEITIHYMNFLFSLLLKKP